MTKIIHITDTHLVEANHLLYGLDPNQRLGRCIDSILQEHADADLCVVTGDLTHAGHPQAYQQLAQQLSRLPMPVHPIIGNHDQRDLFREHFPHTPTDAHGFIQYRVDIGGFNALFLDTHAPGVSYGVFCEQRSQWLAEQLTRDPRPALLFMHHPPFAVGIPSMDNISLLDTVPFTSAIQPHLDRIRHIFFGHLHRPISGSWRGISFSTLRGTNHQVALDLRAQGKVPGSHEPAQYGVVLLSEEQITVHLHDFEDNSPRFWL
ncbi:phosphodiesterase [Serratia sp. DD3]|uniref:phosphodiesterase n=1 Tax=Serratia sp. DD3 TaxID=1410619 RepID=UPI0003C50513|nr:phosphodiesterase [Serratia sp. DD3]KEY57921.1 3',5'-cyclic adenosine monophosphate phosphodiesterase CpdA [Serratia sp. DD3]